MAEEKTEKTEDQNEAHKEELEEMQESAQASPVTEEPSIEEKFAILEKEHLYLRAEMENIKRQNLKERAQLPKFGAERLARDLLDTLDVFRSAMNTEVTEETYKDFVSGIEMTAQSLKGTLEKHGISELECVGKAFDPNTQEALSSEPSDEVPEGHVTQVFKAPYLYHDKLLRAGQVIVSRPKTE